MGIVGVALGGVLAGATGVATSLISARLAKAQIAAQQDEAVRLRRFESLKERREPRQKAYAEFLDHAQAAIASLTLRGQVGAEMSDLGQARAVIAVLGPQPAKEAATEVVRAIMEAAGRLRTAEGIANRSGLLSSLGELLEDFTEVAQRALEDSGEGPQPIRSGEPPHPSSEE